MRLSKSQLAILLAVRGGAPLVEYMTPDRRGLWFRTLGEYVPAKLNYILDGRRVSYRTFWVLFKSNLIEPSKYKGSPSPQDGLTGFHLTLRGYQACQNGGKL
jgi:hypothetical protein